jgi:cytochrome P450
MSAAGEQAGAFEPPHPALLQPGTPFLSSFLRLRRGELDLISIWPEWGFRGRFGGTRALLRWLFVAISPDTVRHVLVDNAANYPKSELLERALRELIGRGMFANNGADWQWRREIGRKAFTPQRLPALADAVPQVADDLVRQWQGLPDGSRIDVSAEMAAATADVVSRALFSVALGQERGRALVAAFADYQAASSTLDLSYLLRMPSWLRFPSLAERRAASGVHRVLASLLKEREGVHRAQPDYIDLLRESQPTPRQIRDEASVMLLAGHETTANAISWALYLVSQTPDVEARIVAEAEAVGGSRETLTKEDAPKLRFTEAVIRETLRLYPPVAFLPRQALNADVVRERRVPAGSVMLVPTWLIHRHVESWRQPHAFIPDRFLDPGGRPPGSFSYLPFGQGPRVCLGASLAMIESTLLLATLCRRFRFALPEGATVRPVCRLTLRPHGGLALHVSRRD